MPELPEVETVVRGLRQILIGQTFTNVKSYAPSKMIEIHPALGRRKFSSLIVGRSVEEIARRGKNILITLSDDLTLWVHLKMTGKFRYVDSTADGHKHDMVVFDFDTPSNNDDQSMQLRFNDYRRFGRLRLVPTKLLWRQKGLVDLGAEPLEVSAEEFIALCHRRERAIKPALLDQTFLAGIGNIYADESLFYSRIHPRRTTTSLSSRKLRELLGNVQWLLKRSIKLMGTTVDSYSGVNGQPGTFQNYLLVYGREGAPCSSCSSVIRREKIGSRSAHFCPRCQRAERSR